MAAADAHDGFPAGTGPRVFISYAHDSERHKNDVLELARFLTTRGIRVELDTWNTSTRRDWLAWAADRITGADYVLAIASARYRQVGDGNAVADLHRGVQYETAVLRELLHGDRSTWLSRLLPILLPGHSLAELPLFLQPYTATHFLISAIDDAGLDELLRVLTGQPSDSPPQLGLVPVLPPRGDTESLSTPYQRGVNGWPLTMSAPTARALEGATFALRAADAPADAVDPLLSEIIGWMREPTAPMQLPATIRDFTGRQDLLGLIEDDLGATDRERSRAVVLTALSGKGGVGKTTLAVHAAHRLASGFPDGQLYVNLRGMEAERLDPSDVLADFLLALGTPAPAIPDSMDGRARLFRSTLAPKHVLVVLDNAADVGQLRPLLPGSPSCGVLITSRSPLAGLESVTMLAVDVLSHEHSLELLGKLVGLSRVTAEPKAADRLVELCGRLPLALRISGAKLAARAHRKIAELVARLDAEHTRLDVLKAGDLEVRASFALSYDGLPTAQRNGFKLLSILNVPDFSSWTAARLLGLNFVAAEEMLDHLVDAQLIEGWGHDATNTPRFRYHDLLRVFARERLTLEDTAEDRNRTLRDAVNTYVFAASWADNELNPISQRPSRDDGSAPAHLAGWAPPSCAPLDWFEAERACLTTVIEQAYESGLWDLVVRLANTTTTFFELRAYWSEARRCNELGLAASQQIGDQHGEAAAHLDLGIIYRYEENWQEAADAFLACIAIVRPAGDDLTLAYAQMHLGDVCREQNRWAEAMACFDECLPLFVALGDRRGEAYTLRSTGAIYRDQNRWAEAMACFDECLPLFVALGDRRGEAQAIRSMGSVYRERGEHTQALDCFTRCLSIFHELGDQHWEAYVLREIGAVYRETSRPDLAIKCLTTAIEIFDRLDDPLCGAHAHRTLGDIHLDMGDIDRALPPLHQALATFERLGVIRGQAHVRQSLGLTAKATGRYDDATSFLTDSAQLFEDIGDHLGAERVRENLAAMTNRSFGAPGDR
jgi:tetratricopeptide (TPR) repeat protein